MSEKIRIAIAGYGNIGKGVETAIAKNSDMKLTAIFTRRDANLLNPATKGVQVYSMEAAKSMQQDIDVVILCGGSATDLPVQTPELAAFFSTVDSFDTHAKIPQYFDSVDAVAKKSGNISIISVGWDPGMFSINRLYSEAIIPDGSNYTFWGKGVSQGHSDAVRRIEGVKNAIQYTIPIDSAVNASRSGSQPVLSTREKHKRVCFVVANEGADLSSIEKQIKEMPNYFADYDTQVNFISEGELKKEHSKMPHGGFVIRSGQTSEGNTHVIEYSLKLDSNPEFTASILVAYARAAYRLKIAGDCGAKTVFDIAPGLLCKKSAAELRTDML